MGELVELTTTRRFASVRRSREQLIFGGGEPGTPVHLFLSGRGRGSLDNAVGMLQIF